MHFWLVLHPPFRGSILEEHLNNEQPSMNSRQELRRAWRHTHLLPSRPSVQKQLAGAAARTAITWRYRSYRKNCCQPAQTLNIVLSPDCGHQKALSIVRHRSIDSVSNHTCTTVTSHTTKFEKEHSNEVKAHAPQH